MHVFQGARSLQAVAQDAAAQSISGAFVEVMLSVEVNAVPYIAIMTESKIEEAPKDSYRLKRDIAATTRLNLQHYIWKENIGYLIHPSVDVSNPNLSIADVGTGTGYVFC